MFNVVRDVRQICASRSEFGDVGERAFERLAYEIRRVNDKDDHEREKIILKLENELLKFERRLPSATKEEEPKDEA